MNGPILLKRYLRSTKQTPADLARASGLHESTISRALKGKQRLGIDAAGQIEDVAGESVPATAWRKPRRHKSA